jgi:hypothetical protein
VLGVGALLAAPCPAARACLQQAGFQPAPPTPLQGPCHRSLRPPRDHVVGAGLKPTHASLRVHPCRARTAVDVAFASRRFSLGSQAAFSLRWCGGTSFCSKPPGPGCREWAFAFRSAGVPPASCLPQKAPPPRSPRPPVAGSHGQCPPDRGPSLSAPRLTYRDLPALLHNLRGAGLPAAGRLPACATHAPAGTVSPLAPAAARPRRRGGFQTRPRQPSRPPLPRTDRGGCSAGIAFRASRPPCRGLPVVCHFPCLSANFPRDVFSVCATNGQREEKRGRTVQGWPDSKPGRAGGRN